MRRFVTNVMLISSRIIIYNNYYCLIWWPGQYWIDLTGLGLGHLISRVTYITWVGQTTQPSPLTGSLGNKWKVWTENCVPPDVGGVEQCDVCQGDGNVYLTIFYSCWWCDLQAGASTDTNVPVLPFLLEESWIGFYKTKKTISGKHR